MTKSFEDITLVKTPLLAVAEALEPVKAATLVAPVAPSTPLSRQAIRSSLRASTLDGVFSTLFACITAEVLLSNFLLDLGATSVEIGLLSAIPMLANFLQPIGAYLADRTTSRRWYSLQMFSPSRLLWLVLVFGISLFSAHLMKAHQLVQWTLLIVLVTHILGALGSASWVSWMAVLVPLRLRGRYFGLRNSAANLTSLLCVPLLGLVVSGWKGGSVQGYGVVLVLAVVAGLISLGCQLFMVDVNPLSAPGDMPTRSPSVPQAQSQPFFSFLKDRNFLIFLFYYGFWMFAVNLSAPFFNIYLLKDLGLDVSWVTLYSSMTAGANVLMLVIWGRLADRIGNRPILVWVGIAIVVIPLLWLGAGTDAFSRWLWLPLLYLFMGGAWSAIDLCSNNLQMAIAPLRQPSSYFAIAAALGGLGGALGTTAGGVLAQLDSFGGLPALFVLSAILRLVALFPLIFVREPRSRDLKELLGV
ncbi:MAG TPA: MFS transporter [Cyanobacteria bacterium UBA8803]|nr:MFS transporter [Cyanobacteria bacterium UBA9273]HBL58550.1 MFS transporter [Cyanobacteria bacterium UBA8803]